jgi:hypothetical protein
MVLVELVILAAGPPQACSVPGTGGFMSAMEIDGGFLCMTWGGMGLSLVEMDGSRTSLFETSDSGFESISEPAAHGGRIAFTGRGRSGDELVVIDTDGVGCASFGPFAEAGNPSWDSSGHLWFTADGALWMDGEKRADATGDVPMRISPSGNRAAWTLDDEGLVLFDVEQSLADTVRAGGRLLQPFWIDDDRILVPGLDGMVWLIRGDTALPLIAGESPSWSPAAGGFFLADTRDDGLSITSSEIFFSTLSGSTARVRAPEGAIPVRPSACSFGVVAIDASTGALILMPFDRRSATLLKPARGAGPTGSG